MAGSFDEIIQQVMRSRQAQPVGDVVQFPEPLMQDDASPEHFWLDKEINQFPPSGRTLQQWYKSLQPANEANLGQAILRG